MDPFNNFDPFLSKIEIDKGIIILEPVMMEDDTWLKISADFHICFANNHIIIKLSLVVRFNIYYWQAWKDEGTLQEQILLHPSQ